MATINECIERVAQYEKMVLNNPNRTPMERAICDYINAQTGLILAVAKETSEVSARLQTLANSIPAFVVKQAREVMASEMTQNVQAVAVLDDGQVTIQRGLKTITVSPAQEPPEMHTSDVVQWEWTDGVREMFGVERPVGHLTRFHLTVMRLALQHITNGNVDAAKSTLRLGIGEEAT